MTQPLVSIIIINWNGSMLLKKLLPTLKRINYKKTETIIVDNGSTDDSLIYLNKYFPEFKIIRNKTNLGFAEANNQGIKKSKGEMVLFLNNDTQVTKNFLTVLVNRLKKDEKMGACQPKILSSEKPGYLDSIGSFLTTSGFLYHLGFEAKDTKKLDNETKLFSGKGSCLLFKRKVLDKIGFFDKDFFAYFEETDLCWRLWLAGYYVLYIPEVSVFHKSWATAKRLPIEFINFHSFKNRISSLIMNLEFHNLMYILPLHIIICILLIIYYLLQNKPKISLAILKAFYWNINNANKTAIKRNKVQSKIRLVKDSEIFPIIMKNAGLSYYWFILRNSLIRSRVFIKQ